MLGDSINNSSERNSIELDLGEKQDAELCRVATIDIGTNSTHLLIAKIERKLNTFSIELAEKSTTRLGERDPQTGELTSLAMNRAFSTLKRFKDLSESYKVESLIIAATSAVREAPNGKTFISEIKKKIGLDVELISGPVSIKMPENIKITSVETSAEMLDAVLGKIPYCDVFISAAAISDYRPSHKLTEKHKSSDGELVIRLERGEDILKLAKETKAGLYAVGFSAETNNISDNAKIKLEKKNIDMIISNEANHQKGLGFESDMNEVCIIEKDSMLKISKNTKKIIADIILSRIAKNIKGNFIKIKNVR